ncbi:MAG: aminotransferase class V-fold PLP-dependent enzyme [Polyangiaceae bacterium]|nr:aminotransferase class V-fold PLP-dependent enzyme [Polyangiaceae bacterium]
MIGASVDDVVFTSNATSGVNAVLRSRRWSPGDVVLTTNQDYVGCRSALLEIASRERLEVRVVALPFPLHDPGVFEQRLLDAVDSRVRLALIDHVTSATGLVLPIAPVVSELESRGVEVLVDGAHAPGMVPLDLDALGASYYAGNAYKWLCAPKGTGLLHVRRDRQANLVPGTISVGTRFPRPGRNTFHERFDWPGTTDPTAWLSLPTAIGFLEDVLPGGMEAVRSQNRALVLEGRAMLLELFESEPPAPESWIGSMASLPLPPRFTVLADDPAGSPLSPLVRRLADDHGVEVPIARLDNQWILRISAQIYNSPDQYKYLADVLQTLAAERPSEA